MRRLRIWDLPTRLFHWALAVCVAGMLITAQSDDWLPWHVRLGVVTLSLVIFRVVWGLIGGGWSRFGQFVPSLGRLKDYVAGRYVSPAGHNPLGALSVLGILVLLFLQVCTGMMMQDDDIGFTGALYPFVPNAWADLAHDYHEEVGQPLIYAWIALHVLAIIWHVRRHNPKLVHAMVTGDQEVGEAVQASTDTAKTRLLALALWLIILIALFSLV